MSHEVYLSAQQVRELLSIDLDLTYREASRYTFAGWAIDGKPVHGATVEAMIRRGEAREVPVRAVGGRNGAITRRVTAP